MNNKGFMRLAIWTLIVFMIFSLLKQINQSVTPSNEIAYSDFLNEVQSKNIKSVEMREVQGGTEVQALTIDDKKIVTMATHLDRGLIGDLINNDVKFDVKVPEEPSMLMTIFVSFGPMLLLVGVWIFFMKKMQGGGAGGLGGFGKSKARMLDKSMNAITFADVAGCDEAKEEVAELVEFLRNPAQFQKLGGRIPRGCLLVGPPGTGKTLIAKAIAGEAKVPFFTISGSDFVEMYVGVGAARVRDMFSEAKKRAPCIIFIDEIDAVGRQRGAGLGGGNDEREQTLNQMLVEMDGFDTNIGVIIVAAPNRPDILDPALFRPGRFDRQVFVTLPDVRGREQILHVHMRKVPIGKDIRADILARGTPGFSGADLANLVNEAALFAARRKANHVGMIDFEKAKEKIMMGPERKSMIMPESERRNTAYHESGHVLVARLMPKTDPVHKVTIIPRGRALGVTMQLPEADRYSSDKVRMLSMLAMLFGGRIAEEVFMDEMTTGASNDFERATQIAREMVTRYGMSEKIGVMVYAENEGEVFLGRSVTQTKNVSEETLRIIEAEVKRIIDEQYAVARALIVSNKDKMHVMAKALLEWETLDADQIDDIMNDRPPRKPAPAIPVDDPVTTWVPPLEHVAGIDPDAAKLAAQLGMTPLSQEEIDKEKKD